MAQYEAGVESLYQGLGSSKNPLPAKYKYLEVEIKLVRPKGWKPEKAPTLSSSEDVVKFFKTLEDSDRERMCAVLVDTANHIIGLHEVTVGSATETLAPPKELFRAAILAGATGLIFVHNHPSGRLEFSSADRAIINRLKEVGKLLDVRVMDFVIIGVDGDFVSAQAQGMMRF